MNNVVVTIKVGVLEDNKTELEFDSIFDPKPGAEEELKNAFQGVFQDAAQGLEKLANKNSDTN